MSELLKEIVEEGTGAIPKPGDTVSVHYTGTFSNGDVFDSSLARDEPFSFTLGAGQVTKGWDRSIADMKLGEKAKITCPPEYAYGEKGYPGVIPPHATLIFDVTLLEIN